MCVTPTGELFSGCCFESTVWKSRDWQLCSSWKQSDFSCSTNEEWRVRMVFIALDLRTKLGLLSLLVYFTQSHSIMVEQVAYGEFKTWVAAWKKPLFKCTCICQLPYTACLLLYRYQKFWIWSKKFQRAYYIFVKHQEWHTSHIPSVKTSALLFCQGLVRVLLTDKGSLGKWPQNAAWDALPLNYKAPHLGLLFVQVDHRSLKILDKKFPFFQDLETPCKPNRALKVLEFDESLWISAVRNHRYRSVNISQSMLDSPI